MIGKRLLCLSDVSLCIEHGVGDRFRAFSAVLLEILWEDRKGEAFNITGDAAETAKHIIVIIRFTYLFNKLFKLTSTTTIKTISSTVQM